MDNKENSAVGGGGLSAEQRNRISQNYRAAKALLARKRGRESNNVSLPKLDGKEVGCPSLVRVNKRVPLSDISTNMSTACSSKNFMLTAGEYSGRKLSVPTKQGTDLDSFRTPVRKPCEFDNFSLQRPDACTTLGPVNNRAPLSDIQANGSVPCSTKNFMLTDSKCIGNNLSISAIQGAGLDSFRTPIKLPNPIWSGGIGSSLTSKDMAVHAECGKLVGSFPIRGPGFTSSSCSRNTYASRIELSNCISGNLRAIKMTNLDENGKSPDPLTTPARQLKCIESSSPMDVAGNITKSSEGGSIESKGNLTVRHEKDFCLSESHSVLDEDLDESILQEIDALCESKPEAIARPQDMAGTMQMKSQCSEMDGRDCKTDAGVVDLKEIIITEELLDSDDVRNCVKEESKISEMGCMPEAYAKYMQSLNDKQREAACCDISIPLMVVAGPGSGKTSTMVGRVLMLLNEGISPSNILAMTFTTAAASEMRDRIGAVAGKEVAKELMISTFHSFSLQLCRSHAEKLERTPEFLIYGQGQQRRATIEAIRLWENGKKAEDSDVSKLAEDTSGINSPQYLKDKAKKWLKFVTQAKASGKNSQECQKAGDEIGAAILQNYSNILKSCNALDYHDLISCSVKLLTDFPEVLKECQESWKAIVIDEFQDTSAMQYSLLRILASHNRITIVGDEDQSIFSFNGANAYGFNSFRNNFPMYKEIRLDKNYRSTRCIIEAASFLIRNNAKRSHTKRALTDNTSGSKITVKECCSEDAQCAYVVDKILESTCDGSFVNSSFGNVAVLYRRQVSGKIFQKAFRDRKIPFNIHGVAFYRKKVVRTIISMLNTTLPGCDDSSFRRVFKALLSFEKEEKKKVVEHVDKISTVRRCSFISAARDIFSAKISGTFKRNQLTQGRKALQTLDMISKLVNREQSISAVISSVANMIPQKYLLEQRAVIDVDGGKLLNEDNDIRSVLQYLLDDVSEYLSLQKITVEKTDTTTEEKGCLNVLKGFIDYISLRESENFRTRRHENEHSVTLTTIHQSKGLEWDTVFIVKTNESEIPLLHESNGVTYESTSTLEEERRLLYVAMTRARKKLFILYVLMDSNWQVIQPSRFLKEIPKYLQDGEDEENLNNWKADGQLPEETLNNVINGVPSVNEVPKDSMDLACNGNSFLKRFSTEDRSVVSHLFHHWGKKAAFQEPKRLLGKVGFVIDERLRVRKSTHKDVLRELKSCLSTDEAFQYAEYVLKWEQIPADQRAYIMREKQGNEVNSGEVLSNHASPEHFLKLRIENAMGSSEPTPKQISYLRTLGCTVVPTSRLHASRLIEQYKAL